MYEPGVYLKDTCKITYHEKDYPGKTALGLNSRTKGKHGN